VCPWTRKWFPVIMNGILVLVSAHFSAKLAHGTYCLCSITQLFRLLGIVEMFPMLMSTPCSGDFNYHPAVVTYGVRKMFSDNIRAGKKQH